MLDYEWGPHKVVDLKREISIAKRKLYWADEAERDELAARMRSMQAMLPVFEQMYRFMAEVEARKAAHIVPPCNLTKVESR